MFIHHCTACDRRQLIFPSMVTGLATTDLGTELTFTCWCGAEQAIAAGNPVERERVSAA